MSIKVINTFDNEIHLDFNVQKIIQSPQYQNYDKCFDIPVIRKSFETNKLNGAITFYPIGDKYALSENSSIFIYIDRKYRNENIKDQKLRVKFSRKLETKIIEYRECIQSRSDFS